MSKLKELIDKYCPNGVEYRKLGEVCKISRGIRVTRDVLFAEGLYPVYQNALKPLGYFNKTNRKAYTTFIIGAGAAGQIGFSEMSFWAAYDCYTFDELQGINDKYIYYFLQTKQHFINSNVRRSSIPRISRDVFAKIEIPIPPIEVQEEIVRILDHFADLAAELQAELQARQEQYEYYRNKLLTFSEIGGTQGVIWMKMSEIFEMRNGYTPSKSNPKFWENGTIPWFRMEDIRQNGRILADSIQHITPIAIKGKGLFEANSFIMATTATIGEHALLIADSLANQQFTNFKIRKSLSNRLLVKFVYYYMFIIGEWCKRNTNVSGFASVDMTKLKNLSVPIPPITEQERIVSILDKFESLVGDLVQGLPAEIAAVQEQYEYYRNKLLSFPEYKLSA